MGAATVKNSMEVPQKFKSRTTTWFSNYTLGIYLKKTKTVIQKEVYTPMFIAALFTISKIWKQLKCQLIDEDIRKIVYIYTYIHTHNGIIRHCKNKILPIATSWIDLEGMC